MKQSLPELTKLTPIFLQNLQSLPEKKNYKIFILEFWPFAKVFSREYEPYFECVKVFVKYFAFFF